MSAVKLTDINGNPISAQAAYDAAMSGLVYIGMREVDLSEFIIPAVIMVRKSGEEITTVMFSCITGSSTTMMFYAGTDPTGGVS